MNPLPSGSGRDDLSDLLPRFDLRGMDLSLDRVQEALGELQQPAATIPAVQVVGTNGKGSIACFIHHALMAAGLRSGLTISPHLVSWCERIRVNERLITIEELRCLLQTLQSVVTTYRLTPFEQLICAALVHFEAQRPDWLVLEAGLGGRLDATTAHPRRRLIAVGSIGLDHREHLGATLEAIATEKAAAIPPGSHVVSGAQLPEVQRVLERAVSAMDASLRWVEPLANDWTLGLTGDLQRSNAGVARAALEWMARDGKEITVDAMRDGFAAARWPGRLQWMQWEGRRVRVDGAHNPPAAKALANERCRWMAADQPQIWVLAIQAHKQAPAMLKHLLQPNDLAWIIPVPEHRSWSVGQLQHDAPEFAHQLRGAGDAAEALNQLEHKGWPQAAPVVAGSLYLIGHLLKTHQLQAE